MPINTLDGLVQRIRSCDHCSAELPLGPRPVVQVSIESKILVVGQAPGRLVHESGIPFNDPSGDRLRNWMGITCEEFYDSSNLALIPMGFCYPGAGSGGDLPPLKVCAEKWREPLLSCLGQVELTLVIGQYAHAYHFVGQQKKNLTETVRDWQSFWPKVLPMPHPSPRNNRWLVRNPWFENEVVPTLRERVKSLLCG